MTSPSSSTCPLPDHGQRICQAKDQSPGSWGSSNLVEVRSVSSHVTWKNPLQMTRYWRWLTHHELRLKSKSYCLGYKCYIFHDILTISALWLVLYFKFLGQISYIPLDSQTARQHERMQRESSGAGSLSDGAFFSEFREQLQEIWHDWPLVMINIAIEDGDS